MGDIEQHSTHNRLARVAILNARRRSRWKRFLAWATTSGASVIALFALNHLFFTLPGIVSVALVVLAVLALMLASDHGLRLLMTYGEHKSQIAHAERQAEVTDPKELNVLVALEIADIETRRAETRQRLIGYVKEFGARAFLAAGSIGLLVGLPALAWHLLMEGGDAESSFLLILMASFFFIVPMFIFSFSAARKALDVSEEASEARQLEEERAIVVDARQKMGGGHLSGAISMSSDTDESLRGAISQSAETGGLSEVE